MRMCKKAERFSILLIEIKRIMAQDLIYYNSARVHALLAPSPIKGVGDASSVVAIMIVKMIVLVV